MTPDWRPVNRFLVGEEWNGSRLTRHAVALCDRLGPRWASTPAEHRAAADIGELKDHVGQLARLLLRLSHLPPDAWPACPVTPERVEVSLDAERGVVVRVL